MKKNAFIVLISLFGLSVFWVLSQNKESAPKNEDTSQNEVFDTEFLGDE